MAMNPDTLKADIKAETLAQIKSLFPPPEGLTTDELALIEDAQERIAEAVAFGDAPITVDHIQSTAEVDPNDMAVVPSAMSNSAGALSGNGKVSVGKGKVL